MRVNPNMVPNILADLQQSQATLNTALQEVATGKSVNAAFRQSRGFGGQWCRTRIETANVDQYTQNVTSVLDLGADRRFGAQLRGHLAHPGRFPGHRRRQRHKLPPPTSQTLATQVQGILTSVVAQANTSVRR